MSSPPALSGARLRSDLRIARYLIAGGIALYLADWGVFTLRPRFEWVHVQRFYAVREKFNKMSYEPTDAREERCTHALFPQGGSRPCWYAARHRSELIDLN